MCPVGILWPWFHHHLFFTVEWWKHDLQGRLNRGGEWRQAGRIIFMQLGPSNGRVWTCRGRALKRGTGLRGQDTLGVHKSWGRFPHVTNMFKLDWEPFKLIRPPPRCDWIKKELPHKGDFWRSQCKWRSIYFSYLVLHNCTIHYTLHLYNHKIHGTGIFTSIYIQNHPLREVNIPVSWIHFRPGRCLSPIVGGPTCEFSKLQKGWKMYVVLKTKMILSAWTFGEL